jgi:N-formylglutamate amidohydrolase
LTFPGAGKRQIVFALPAFYGFWDSSRGEKRIMRLPFFISIPHSGEKVAEETPWLNELPETVLMCDPDRYVDRLYRPVIERLSLPSVVTEWHRYVVDLNRIPQDIDEDSVVGALHPSGTHPKGFHWSVTTKGDRLIPQPMSMELHETLVKKYYQTFHRSVEGFYRKFEQEGHGKIFQLDAHSMPSKGEKLHRDPGQTRAEIVVSDCSGQSCEPAYTELVISAYERAGFQVAHNWPYLGGRITELYGKPQKGHHAIQVELNRMLYMDEQTKKLKDKEAAEVSAKISKAVETIVQKLPELLS